MSGELAQWEALAKAVPPHQPGGCAWEEAWAADAEHPMDAFIAASSPDFALGVVAAVRRCVEAHKQWEAVAADKIHHILTCLDCKRLEVVEDRWCDVAAGKGRPLLDAISETRAALRDLTALLGES